MHGLAQALCPSYLATKNTLSGSGRLIRNENVQYFNEVLLIDVLLSQNNLSGVTPLGDGL